MAFHFLIGETIDENTPEIVVNGKIEKIFWEDNTMVLQIQGKLFTKRGVTFDEFVDLCYVLTHTNHVYVQFNEYVDLNKRY